MPAFEDVISEARIDFTTERRSRGLRQAGGVALSSHTRAHTPSLPLCTLITSDFPAEHTAALPILVESGDTFFCHL